MLIFAQQVGNIEPVDVNTLTDAVQHDVVVTRLSAKILPAVNCWNVAFSQAATKWTLDGLHGGCS
jgi:hypothetical protein